MVGTNPVAEGVANDLVGKDSSVPRLRKSQ